MLAGRRRIKQSFNRGEVEAWKFHVSGESISQAQCLGLDSGSHAVRVVVLVSCPMFLNVIQPYIAYDI